ncbi:MAG: transposase [Phycisphaerae bacterium]|nr:transposase [Phycisphaerae bacterium]
MKYLDMKLSKASVWRIMVDHGFNPDSEVRNSGDWEKFIKSHLVVLAATDFFTIELLTCKGLVRCMVLFVIDIATCRVHIAGIRINPDGQWTEQIARNFTDYEDGFLNTKKFDDILGFVGVTSVKTVKRSPNLNTYAERFVQIIKKKCLDHLILTNEEQLKYAIDQFIEHYNHERPNENLDGKIIDPWPQDSDAEIIKFERLGGLLKSYRRIRQAA